MHTRAQTRTRPAGISTHLCRSLSHCHYHNDSDSDSLCKTAGNFLSVSQSVIESVLSNEIRIKVRHMAKVWLTRTYAHTHTHSKQRLHRFRINAEKRQRKGFHFQQSRGKDSLYQDYRSNSSHKSQFCLLPNYLYAADNAGGGRGRRMLFEERVGAVGMLM